MSKAAILALADRVQALTGPCRETDSAVSIALFPDQHALVDLVRGQMSSWWAMINCITRYTASLDAAISLYPELPDTVPSCPRKATAAALRAIAAQMPDGD